MAPSVKAPDKDYKKAFRNILTVKISLKRKLKRMWDSEAGTHDDADE